MSAVLHERPERLPLRMACRCVGLHRSTVYARKKPSQRPEGGNPRDRTQAPQPRALSAEERESILQALNSEEFFDQPPMQVYMRLLEQGQYLCSISTMYRLLREKGQSNERRPQRPAQHHAIPRLVAQAPNQVWCWDITKLPTIKRGEYLSLYVVIDLFSRYVLAWMLSRKENSALSQQLMREAIGRYPHAAQSLTIHQDRGSPMIAGGYLDVLGEMGATASHSRPRVSNDNAFSESQFKTAKYQPDYPGRFDNYAHAEQWCREYFDWYNLQHHHSGLSGFTPEQVFTGRYRELAIMCEQALSKAFTDTPERFVKGRSLIKLPPRTVAINPLYREDGTIKTEHGVNSPTLTAAKERANANLH